MRNLILAVLLASNSAAAQEFSYDADALNGLLARAEALKTKHSGRPAPPMVSDYDARRIGFKLRRAGGGREDGVVYVNKSLEIYFDDSPLAALRLNDDPSGWADAERALRAFESLRREAIEQKRRIVIDYDAIRRQNEAGGWGRQDPKERELFDGVIRLGILPAGR